jgi:hypothetical protein
MFIVILAIGLGLITYGIYNLFVRSKTIPMSKTITGTVIDMHATSARRGRTAYYPIVEYYNPETDAMDRFKHEVANGRSQYNIGDSLELLYYGSGNRKQVLINTWSGKWSVPTVSIFAGLVFTAAGVLMIFL